MDAALCKLGITGTLSSPQLHVERKIGRIAENSEKDLDIRVVLASHKVVHSGSEDNLFWKRHLNTRSSTKPRVNVSMRKTSSLGTVINEMHIPVFNTSNRGYICRYASDTMFGKRRGDSRCVPPSFQADCETEDEEVEIANIVQDKHENWSQKYKNWHENADLEAISGWMSNLSDAGFDLQSMAKCSLRQQAAIAQYISQMLECGYKLEFAKEVFRAMIVLYITKIWGYTIEECLPEFIKPEDYSRDNPDNRSPLTCSESYREHREWITDHLRRIMEFYGGDYQIISEYCRRQQRDSSWCETSRLLKGFYLDQRADLNKDRFYFLVGNEIGNGARSRRWGFGPTSFIEHFHDVYPANSPEYDMYFKTIAMYQGFTAVALNYIDGITGLDRKSGMLTVYRVTNRHYIPGQLQGILDSTSLEGPVHFIAGENAALMEIMLPFCDAKFIYFLSQELCERGKRAAEEREVICDLSNAQITDQTVIDLQKPAEIIITSINNSGEIGMSINGIGAYLVKPYLVNLGSGNEAVFLHDKYHFWEDHVSMQVGNIKHKGYTNNPQIVQIAQMASKGVLSEEDIGKLFT